MAAPYTTGSVTVTNGSAAVAGVGTGWAIALISGGILIVNGESAVIGQVNSDTTLTLVSPWRGATASAAPYEIARENAEASRNMWAVDRMSESVARMAMTAIAPDGAGALASRPSTPADGYVYLVIEPGKPVYVSQYRSGAWVDAASIGGLTATTYAGVGVPPVGTGIDGSTYLDIANGDTYARVAGVWVLSGSIKGPTGSTGSLIVTTRTALKAVDTVTFQMAFLTETGREGHFIWKTGDYSAKITADAAEGEYVKADAIASTAGAWVRVEDVRTGEHRITNFGAVSGTGDDRAAIQSAYNVADDGDTIVFPTGTWSCLTPLTLSGTKRVKFHKDPGAVMDATTATNAMPEAANTTGHMWQEVEQKTVYIAANGGFKLFSGTLRGTGADTTGQRDVFRVEMRAEGASSGPSWDGVGGTDINRDHVAGTFYGIAAPGSLYRSIWGLNTSAYFEAGSDGQGTSIEANIHVDAGIAAVKELNIPKRKLGFFAVSQGGQKATAAFAFEGTGFFKGLVGPQSALADDPATRFIELTDKFEVGRDGAVYVGKGGADFYTAGAELSPAGTLSITGHNTASVFYLCRDDTLTGPVDITAMQTRAKNSAGADKAWATFVISTPNPTAGAEESTITWQTIGAGVLGSRFTLSSTAFDFFVPIKMSGTQVLGTRKTGWSADSGTAKRTANATYSGTAGASYVQATMQALMDAVRDQSQALKALKDDFISHGAIGA